MKIKMEKINLNTSEKNIFFADVQSEKDSNHLIYSLLFEGYRTEWKEQTNDKLQTSKTN